MTAIIVLWILLGLIALIVILLHFSVTVEIKGGTNSDFVLKIKYMGFTVYPRPPKSKKKKSVKPKKNRKAKENLKEFTDDLEDDFDGEDQDEQQDLTADTEQIADFAEISQKEETESLSQMSENTLTADGDKPADSPAEQGKSEVGKKSDKEKKKKFGKKAKEKSQKADSKSGGKLDDLKQKYYMIKPYIPMGWKYFKKLLKTIRFTNTKIDIVTGKEDAYESAMFYGKIQAALFNVLAVISGIFTVKLKKADVHCVFNEKKLEANGETVIKVRPSAMIAISVCIAVSFLKIFLRQRHEKKKAEKAKQSIKTDSNENNDKSENSGNAA